MTTKLIDEKDVKLVIDALRLYRNALPKTAISTRYRLIRLEKSYIKMLDQTKEFSE